MSPRPDLAPSRLRASGRQGRLFFPHGDAIAKALKPGLHRAGRGVRAGAVLVETVLNAFAITFEGRPTLTTRDPEPSTTPTGPPRWTRTGEPSAGMVTSRPARLPAVTSTAVSRTGAGPLSSVPSTAASR
jgi:hypothetical protein